MTALVIVLAVFLFLFLLLLIPIQLRVDANEENGARATLKILFYKKQLFPMPPKKPKKAKPKKKQSVKKKPKPQKKKQTQKPDKKDVAELIKLIYAIAKAVLKKFPKHFRVHIYAYEISVATDDAAKTAILYGTVTGLSAELFAFLRYGTKFSIGRNAPCNVYTDFVSEKSRANMQIGFSLNLFGLIAMAFSAAMAFVKCKLKKTNTQIETSGKDTDHGKSKTIEK